MTPEERLIEVARSFVGTVETGPNRGPLIEEFQKAVDGAAKGEAWCASFLIYCVNKVDAELGSATSLFKSESALDIWSRSPKELRLPQPIPGCVAVWQHHDVLGRPTWMGHIGIVTEIVGEFSMRCCEGNTSPGFGIAREGDGVYERVRSSYIGFLGSMRLKGFLRVWPVNSDSSESPEGSAPLTA